MVILGIGGKPLLFQPAVHELAHDGIEHGKERDAKDHARHAEQAADQDDGKDDPKGSQPGGFALNARADDLRVDLLCYDR